MLINIKSKYIVAKIFSFIEEKKKLLIVSYNKDLQTKLDRNINYYKIVSQKYLEKNNNNRIVKIYSLNDDSLLYEGEYLNKKKNGIGKEYNEGKIIFEGEFKNGKRNGKGKEYDIFKNLVFEGEYKDGNRLNEIFNIYSILGKKLSLKIEYKNGKIWNAKWKDFEIINGKGKGKGKFKLFGFSGPLIFEGEFLNGEINGKGKEYQLHNKLFFEGEYKNGKRNGYGIEYYYNGKLKFEGVFKDGLIWEGKGYNINGELESEIINGKGNYKEYSFKGQLFFEGEIFEGKKHGNGKEYDIEKKVKFNNEKENGQQELIYFSKENFCMVLK